MAAGGFGPGRSPAITTLLPLLLLLGTVGCQVLNPPYFNLAEARKIYASATCGEGVFEPELYCKLVGANTDWKDNPDITVIQGQWCDYCDPKDAKRAHPAENAIDGTQQWWQSPPLSRGNKYNEVNLTIDLGQEFHVAYIFIKMGNSPRPGVWILERSTNNGETYTPWQYFADTPGDCVNYFGPNAEQSSLTHDDSVICETKFSKVVPLEGGEIVVSLLNDRPNADNFSYSPVLQEFTKATNVRLRFLRTKTLLGHLMSVARQDPTVTRRYFYSIKDINIGGRCVCNGHAETCDVNDPNDPYKLLCQCQHHTCGPQCEQCCPGFQQKMWRRAIIDSPFICEPCNCFGHSDECIYDEEIDRKRQSLDIHGLYEGGGVCQNCRHNTEGINCNRCKPTFYRPYGKLLNATDVCQPCNCDPDFSTGNCADGSGQCECRQEFLPPRCDYCNVGYYGYPFCRPCDCHPNGTHGNICEVGGGQCPCKPNFSGQNCDRCQEGFYGFPECLPCDCNPVTSLRSTCDDKDGQCFCRGSYGGRQCERCAAGYYSYPSCEYCSCDPLGCTEEICDNITGSCLCKPGYGGLQCDRCAPGYFGYPNCLECQCDEQGSVSSVCDNSGRCRCLSNYAGLKCNQCSPGYYNFPECLPCECGPTGSIGISCNNDGHCVCRSNFDGEKCDMCKEEFYNYPLCEECNCNPAGVLATFLGCGSLTSGELCECKERVTGRICNECQPLYWNLKISNPLGCEDCNCYLDGTVGEIGVCERTTGQCMCKPNVGTQQCSECRDGSYQLDRDDLFGCKDCGCDIGGSVSNVCDKESGQCACRPRINGLQCDKPLQTHYFPTLFQHQFEIEDGRTPSGTQVRYGYDENVFPGFSWRGYAVFSDIQKEVLLDIYVEKPSLYQVLFYYLNFAGDNVFGTITFTPDIFGDIQQSSDMVFEAKTQPKFMKVSGKQGLIAAPFVLNPGRWTVSIRIEKPLFLDYMVLLPQSYYEATLIQEDVNFPCSLNGNSHEMCRNFRYPTLPVDAEVVRGEAGYVADDDERIRTNLYAKEDVLQELQTGRMAWLEKEQHSLHMDFRVAKPGPYVVFIIYHTPEGGHSTTAKVEVTTANQMNKGKAVLYDCTYSFLCRQIVTDRHGKVAVFDLDSNFVSLTIETEEDTSIAVDSVALIPADLWHTDYIVPESLCVRKDGSCIESVYLPVPESTKTEFESGQNEERITTEIPENIINSNIGLIYLHEEDPMVDLYGSVPTAGAYAFIVHYYQPDHPRFDAQVIIQNGQFYEAILPLPYCPSASGCRAVVRTRDTDSTSFQILENYILTLKGPKDKSVWVDYVLAIPATQFHESFLHPLKQDKAGKFITECGSNSFFISPDVEGFCRDAAFSLTSEYNNGALSCQCNTDGSLSYECEEFGGQCLCKPNVIGRTCSQCRTGFFGFPNCKACDCPSTAYCHAVTGQCICPPRVTGDRCDTCVPYTYGFDPIIGCEECNCSPLGVYQGSLQCDLQTGQCRCKSNVVGRMCDKCKSGYWAFPYCQLCNCDVRGSTEDICEQDTARCFCKENVYGDSCDQCKPGTFYLEETNPLGCTKCFCFGTTDRCTSTYLSKIQVLEMRSWKEMGVKLDNDFNEVAVDSIVEEAGDSVRAILPLELPTGTLFYFSAPEVYTGNKLTSYGGVLSYTILTAVDRDVSVGSIVGPDLILIGNNITIVHDHLEQPAGGLPLEIRVNIVEREFHHISGREVTREQIMMVLVNLKSLLIRGSYFQPSVEIRLSHVLMDVAGDGFVADTPQALRVEQCQCPNNYKGSSCEECASGHYRAKTGPYLGSCIPCQCHGHAYSCDVNTGKCFDCKHNTIGDHCEMCAAGYHGDATQGTPYDCLICACPLPVETNNFAESCEVSSSGLEISCVCKPGYYGARCEVCAAGYFGEPEVPGSSCQLCQCSGNIDPSYPGSCDSVTGDCVLCLNNTFGAACEICAPGFYGDAVSKKDCKKCNCNECGTQRCDHESGQCVCWPNVEGYACDHCASTYWGFESCGGCRHCNCGPASNSDQCDVETGQCSCRPGAGGLTCDICDPGFWNYSPQGCISCNCDEKYSAGAVCNAVSGQCQCLPGVIGDKCDSCPYRWVFVDNQGCFECDPCVHALLDDTDVLREMIDPVMEELRDASTSYFAYRHLHNVNKTVDTLRIGVDALTLDPSGADFSPLVYDVQSLEKKSNQLDHAVTKAISQASEVAKDADDTRKEALEVSKLIQDTINKAKEIVAELAKLAEGLLGSSGPNVDHLVAEAEYILAQIKERDFEPFRNDTAEDSDLANKLMERVKAFEIPALLNFDVLEELKEKLANLIRLLEELNNHSQSSYGIADDAQTLNEESRTIPVQENIKEITQLADGITEILKEAQDLLDQAHKFGNDAKNAFEKLLEDNERLQPFVERLKDHISDLEKKLDDIKPLTERAIDHANKLMAQAALLDSLLADTRESADAAVKAATAYGNIVDAINDAYEAAESAVNESDEAGTMSDGVAERSDDSKSRSIELLEEASELRKKVGALTPQLDEAKVGVLVVAHQNGKTSRGLDIINKELDKLPIYSLSILARLAANGSAAADASAKKAKDKIQNIIDKLPDDKDRADQVPKSIEDSKHAIKATQNYVDRVSSIVPDMSRLMNRVGKKETALRIIGKDVADKLAELQRKVALARDQANRIKLGVEFTSDTVLQLRNPEGMNQAATYTHVSLYFQTTKRSGLLTYIGNEKGAHGQMKRVLTDDYMALEIRDGRIVLTMDLGSGSEEILHNAYVSDGEWHQVIVERTGKTCTLTVRTQDEADSVVDGFLPGTYSVFNLDQQISKFYVGGIPKSSEVQDDVQYRDFEGCIEELEFGKTPIGLWDFVQAENNFEGCSERDKLVILEPSNGLRFDGSGYAILARKKHSFADKTYVTMNFKTYASEGLLFLIGKNTDFLALELRDGLVFLKYELGSGMAVLISNKTYNDGEWHYLEATREGKEALIKVDNEEVDNGESPGAERSLETTNNIYVGGYRGNHPYLEVTNVDFEGCIKDVQIGAEIKDLNKNIEALGVVSGCPATIARTVSFSNETSGYVGMPSIDLEKFAQLTFKFKTVEEDGIIFYAANEDQSNYLSITLHNGALVMQSSPGGEIKTTSDVKYNDKEWHYVTATKTLRQLRIDIDDIDSVEKEIPVKANVVTTTPLYFGGIPDGYIIKSEAVPVNKPFVGCLGDTTVNNRFQNFAGTQDRQGASLASCPLTDHHQEPTAPPIPGLSSLDILETTVAAPEDKEGDYETEEEKTVTLPGITTPEPTPVGKCALPLYPRTDTDVKSGDGIRFGNAPYSRQEFIQPASFMSSIIDESTFALEFRTSMQNGAMFYVAGRGHIDFLGLFMQEGRVVYVFNCGTGSAVISSQNIYNDGTWHRVVFSRNGHTGRLVIDDEEEVRGTSQGSTRSLNVIAPFYVGGLSEEAIRDAKNNMKSITTSFPGCMRNVEVQGKLLIPKESSLSQNITRCSDKVEEGTFFSADGGYLILYDKYRVGQRISITLDIKPRNLSGVLMSVHGRTDYLILQMIDGRVQFSVDNGAGPITSTYTPDIDHFLCDGQWHTIQVAKSNNVVTLSVDGKFVEPGIGVGGVSSTDTNDPLYIGGVPEPSLTKGVETTEQYAGCMRYLELDSRPQTLAQSRVVGQVTLNACPTI